MRHFMFLIAVMVSLTATAAFAAQNSATTSATANARIIIAISIAKNSDLNFGDVVPGGTAGTVVVDPAAVRTSSGGVSLGSGAAVTAATFTVNGQPSAAYTINVNPASINVSNGGGGAMTVDTFTSNPASPGTLSAGGAQTLAIGGTLNVGASQATGTYSGTFNVTVAYN